jgi:hypothetical protein
MFKNSNAIFRAVSKEETKNMFFRHDSRLSVCIQIPNHLAKFGNSGYIISMINLAQQF